MLQPAVQATTSHSPPAQPEFSLDHGPEMKRERHKRGGRIGRLLSICTHTAPLDETTQNGSSQQLLLLLTTVGSEDTTGKGKWQKGANERRMSDHTQSVRLVHSASPLSTTSHPKSNLTNLAANRASQRGGGEELRWRREMTDDGGHWRGTGFKGLKEQTYPRRHLALRT